MFIGQALKIDCAKCARHRKVTFTSKYHPRMFPKVCYAYVPFAPALFNSNVKCKRIRMCLNAKSKPFLVFNKHHFTVEVREYVQ